MVLRGYQSLFEVAVEGMPSGIRGFQIVSAVIHRDSPQPTGPRGTSGH